MNPFSYLMQKPLQVPFKAPISRLPLLSWQMFSGPKKAQLPCLLDLPGLQLSTSGRASIFLAIELLGLKAGDKVLVPTYHCPTMIAPVVALQMEPVFYPVSETGSARLDWLDKQDLQGVRAILAAHYFGLPQAMRDLRLWCDRHQIALIEDCAHALFGSSDGRAVGRWGDIAISSLTKFLPVPEGGCLQINGKVHRSLALSRPTMIQEVKAGTDMLHVGADHDRLFGFNALLRSAFSCRHLFKRKSAPEAAAPTASPIEDDDSPADGFTVDAELSHRALTWACAWIARHTPRDRIVEQRRRHFKKFIELLSGHQGIRPVHANLPDDAAPYVFPLWVEHPDPGYSELRRLGIPVSRWDRLWPGIPFVAGDAGPIWSHHVLQLACHQDLTDAEIEAIADAVLRLFASGKRSTEPESIPA